MDRSAIDSLSYYYPELVLVGTILIVWVLDLVERRKDVLGNIALFGMALSIYLTSQLYGWGEG
ncbi:MAG: hypothetical protein ACREQ9_19020, partial [Candidatus Binatia bacterium]